MEECSGKTEQSILAFSRMEEQMEVGYSSIQMVAYSTDTLSQAKRMEREL